MLRNNIVEVFYCNWSCFISLIRVWLCGLMLSLSWEVVFVVKNRWVESITNITTETLVTLKTTMTVPKAPKSQQFWMKKGRRSAKERKTLRMSLSTVEARDWALRRILHRGSMRICVMSHKMKMRHKMRLSTVEARDWALRRILHRGRMTICAMRRLILLFVGTRTIISI